MSYLRPLALLLAGLALTDTASGQGFLWGFSSEGGVTLNATSILNLKGGATFDEFTLSELYDLDEYWNTIAIQGPDWWNLRFDGLLTKNGVKERELAFDGIEEGVWVDMLFRQNELWTLRTDGRVSSNGNVVAELPVGGDPKDPDVPEYIYRRLATDGDDVYVLRGDGRVYLNASTPKLVEFGDPSLSDFEDDGETLETEWFALEVDPVDGDVYGLRRDGRLHRFDPDALVEGDGPFGIPVVALPFPSSDADAGDIYFSLTFLEDGRWVALRGDGKVYREGDGTDPIVDLPGQPNDLGAELYVDILAVGNNYACLRQDGRLYINEATQETADFPKGSYTSLAYSTETPDLTNARTRPPRVALYKTQAIVGVPVTVPVLVTDVDTPLEEVVLTVDEETLPEGMTYDPGTATFSWPSPGPAGNYKVKLTADDGDNKRVKATFSFKVRDAETDLETPKKPFTTKIKKAQALVDTPFEMPILAIDRNGDPVTLTADTNKFPFTDGATFDEKTGTFMWTPELLDRGTVKLRFRASNGEKERKLGVKVKVETTLLTLPGGDDLAGK